MLPHECTRWPMGCKSVANKPWWNFVTRDRVTRYLEPAIPLTERERERESERVRETKASPVSIDTGSKRHSLLNGIQLDSFRVPCFRVQIIGRRLEDAKDNEETGGRERC